ncbi:hypothetical protein L484_004511 [Morus notabilis]|uniref:Uncharacterized protein n=1 Tax=Morus notabilis TaxID=981085 RepID=W9R5S9_9ROSA|nr:hypothetical protein L484_004511 [Morus notabilis]
MRHGIEKKTALYRERDELSSGSVDADIPRDYDEKEKFRMILRKSKNKIYLPKLASNNVK